MPSLGRKVLRRAGYELILSVQRLRVLLFRFFSLATVVVGEPRRSQPVLFRGKGIVRFSGIVKLGYFPSPGFLSGYNHIEARGESAVIEFGDGTVINNNFTAIAEHGSIKIGRKVLIGPDCFIADSDFHGLLPEDRGNAEMVQRGDVIIDDDVFIGARVIILKGVHIGSGSVIAAGSVVVNSIPQYTIAGGNPAKVIRSL